MKRLLAAAMFAGVLVLSGSAVTGPASAAAPQAGVKAVASSQATDFSARRYYRYGYRPYYRPNYYARPYYYRPYPYYAPAPFPFGLGFGPFWW
jgi:hypothetical protein